MENILSFGSTLLNPYSYLNSQLAIKKQDDESVTLELSKLMGQQLEINKILKYP
jgi:hypothetical protein